MFEMLENYNNREYVDTSNESITIEHIFPRNPNEDWQDILSNDDNLQTGKFNLGIFSITINNVKTYEKDLIICK